MIELLKNLNLNYSNIITAVATVIYMFFTGWLIWETRMTRKMQEKPHIEIFLKMAEDWGNLIQLVIKNIGYSGAYNIKLIVDKNINILDRENFTLEGLGYFKNGISFLPVNGERENSLTIISTNYEDKIKWKINIVCEYEDGYGKKYKDCFLLDFSEFENVLLPRDKPLYEIEKHLKDIEKHLNKISKGFPKLNVITQTKEQFKIEEEKHRKEYEEYIKGLNKNNPPTS